ncbi:sensor histidine kinase [Sphingomonas sp. UYP23]
MNSLDNASLGAVLKTALDAVVVMRLDGTIAGWNDVAERTFGWTFAEAAGHRMSEMIIPHRYREAHERGLKHYLATGEGLVLDTHLEIEALHQTGREMPVELSITRTEQFGEPVFLGFLRDISERRDAARRQDLMIGELNHRVKNLLGVVSSIAHMTARSSTTLSEFGEAFNGRLSSLGSAHEILTAATWERAPLRSLVDELLGGYAGGPDAQARFSGPDVLLAPRHLLSVSMILHELVTNAVKYGALSRPGGRVSLTWSFLSEHLSLEWIESGLSDVSPPTRRGFGSKMIALSVSHELRGDSTTEWRSDGMYFRLSFQTTDKDGR